MLKNLIILLFFVLIGKMAIANDNVTSCITEDSIPTMQINIIHDGTETLAHIKEIPLIKDRNTRSVALNIIADNENNLELSGETLDIRINKIHFLKSFPPQNFGEVSILSSQGNDIKTHKVRCQF